MVTLHQHGTGTDSKVPDFITVAQHLPQHSGITVFRRIARTYTIRYTIADTGYLNHFFLCRHILGDHQKQE